MELQERYKMVRLSLTQDLFHMGWLWRQGRKKEIKYRRKENTGDTNRGKKNVRNVTSVLFVPSTKDSELFNAETRREDDISSKLSWDIKIVEKGGAPLASVFMNQFPVVEGCPVGAKCVICENDAICYAMLQKGG